MPPESEEKKKKKKPCRDHQRSNKVGSFSIILV
jgi:hypothetical protein